MKNPLKLQTLLIVLLATLTAGVVMLTVVPTYYFFREQLVRDISDSRTEILSQVDANINTLKNEVITISDMFYNTGIVRQITEDVQHSHPIPDTYYRELDNINDYIHQTLSHYSYDYDIQFFAEDIFYYSSRELFLPEIEKCSNTLWFQRALSTNSLFYWQSNLQIKSLDGNKENYVSLLRFIRNEDGSLNSVLMVTVPERSLYHTYESLTGESGNIYIVDAKGQMVSHSTPSMIGHFFYNMETFYELFEHSNNAIIEKLGENFLFSKYSAPESSWIVVEEIPMRIILAPLYQIRWTVAALTFGVLLFAILLSVVIGRTVSRPLSDVHQTMKEATGGNFNVRFKKRGFAEVQWIADECENFVVHIVNLLNDIRKKERQKRITEMHFLQMQINPHFMHNTIFSIKCMVDMGHSERACNMLDALNDMLKNILNTKDQLVSVKDEVHVLKQYGYILQQRYGDSFQICLHVSPYCENELLLRFILQPLIENSVFHGLSSSKQDGRIDINIFSDESQLCLEVSDNGCGMDQNTIDKLLSTSNENSGGNHIGLPNVIARLNLHYNDRASFAIDSATGVGTVVKIRVPRYVI